MQVREKFNLKNSRNLNMREKEKFLSFQGKQQKPQINMNAIGESEQQEKHRQEIPKNAERTTTV